MRVIILLGLLLLAGCAQSDETHKKTLQSLEVGEPASATGRPTVAPTQIAYSYRYGYRLDDGAIDAVQGAHVALCDKLGPARCRIATLTRSTTDGEHATGALSLLVDSTIARRLGAELDKAAVGEGGQNVNREIEAEDLAKSMIDTDARVRAKAALADRLMALIEKGAGSSVADLVAAERAFADAQEELDAARAALETMRGRVAMSKVDIVYESASVPGDDLLGSLQRALGNTSSLLGASLGALVMAVVLIAPWALAIAGLVWTTRRFGWRPRWPWRRRA